MKSDYLCKSMKKSFIILLIGFLFACSKPLTSPLALNTIDENFYNNDSFSISYEPLGVYKSKKTHSIIEFSGIKSTGNQKYLMITLASKGKKAYKNNLSGKTPIKYILLSEDDVKNWQESIKNFETKYLNSNYFIGRVYSIKIGELKHQIFIESGEQFDPNWNSEFEEFLVLDQFQARISTQYIIKVLKTFEKF